MVSRENLSLFLVWDFTYFRAGWLQLHITLFVDGFPQSLLEVPAPEKWPALSLFLFELDSQVEYSLSVLDSALSDPHKKKLQPLPWGLAHL